MIRRLAKRGFAVVPAADAAQPGEAEGWRPCVIDLGDGTSKFTLTDEPYFVKMNGRSDYAVLHAMSGERPVIGFRWRTDNPPAPSEPGT